MDPRSDASADQAIRRVAERVAAVTKPCWRPRARPSTNASLDSRVARHLQLATCVSRQAVTADVVVVAGPNALLFFRRGYADPAPQARPAPRFDATRGISRGMVRDAQFAFASPASPTTAGGYDGIRLEACFPATAGRTRLFPGLPSSEGGHRRHRTPGASPRFARSGSAGLVSYEPIGQLAPADTPRLLCSPETVEAGLRFATEACTRPPA